MYWSMYRSTNVTGLSAELKAADAQAAAQRSQTDIIQVMQRIDALALTCQALWELVQEKTGLTENDIQARMQEIDLRDGVADGRMGGGSVSCSGCGREVSSRRGHCIYCGSILPVSHRFE